MSPIRRSRSCGIACLISLVALGGYLPPRPRSRPSGRHAATAFILPRWWLTEAMCIHRHESTDWHAHTDWLGYPSVDHGGMQIDVGTWLSRSRPRASRASRRQPRRASSWSSPTGSGASNGHRFGGGQWPYSSDRLRGRLSPSCLVAASAEQRERAGGDLDGRPPRHRSRRSRRGRRSRARASHSRPKRRGGSLNPRLLGLGVHEDDERVVDDRLAARGERPQLLAVQEHAEGRALGLPVALGHRAPVGPEPPRVREPRARLAPPSRKPRPPEHRMARAQRDQPPGEGERARSPLVAAPSRTTRSRCPGTRRCCCRPACGRARRRRASIGTPCERKQRGEEVALLAARAAR